MTNVSYRFMLLDGHGSRGLVGRVFDAALPGDGAGDENAAGAWQLPGFPAGTRPIARGCAAAYRDAARCAPPAHLWRGLPQPPTLSQTVGDETGRQTPNRLDPTTPGGERTDRGTL